MGTMHRIKNFMACVLLNIRITAQKNISNRPTAVNREEISDLSQVTICFIMSLSSRKVLQNSMSLYTVGMPQYIEVGHCSSCVVCPYG